MVNVLLPSMGSSMFFKESFFPKPLIDVGGRTMLENVVDNFQTVRERHMVFVFRQADCSEFHLDSSVKILTHGESDVLVLKNETAGALCTCLMAVEFIDNDTPLIISNSDQVIDVDFDEVLKYFQSKNADGGVISFNNIHPRWSYLRTDDSVECTITEVAEKRPLSDHALTGFFYYRKGSDFVSAAKSAILKQNSLKGKYYISSTMNEMILKGKKLVYYEIDRDAYHSFYSPEKIREYERFLMREKG